MYLQNELNVYDKQLLNGYQIRCHIRYREEGERLTPYFINLDNCCWKTWPLASQKANPLHAREKLAIQKLLKPSFLLTMTNLQGLMGLGLYFTSIFAVTGA